MTNMCSYVRNNIEAGFAPGKQVVPNISIGRLAIVAKPIIRSFGILDAEYSLLTVTLAGFVPASKKKQFIKNEK